MNEMTDQDFSEWSAGLMGYEQEGLLWIKEVDWIDENMQMRQDTKVLGKVIGFNTTLTGFVDWNPRHSLDQCFIMEEFVMKNIDNRINYFQMLREVAGKGEMLPKIGFDIHASADQRCRAFYETMKDANQERK